jgi:MYXO-CTERM domain-containing protein
VGGRGDPQGVRRDQRLRGAAIVLSVLAISACLALKLSSLPEPIAMTGVTISGSGSAEYNFGKQSAPVTVTLAFVPANISDNYTVSGVSVVPGSDCGEFSLSEAAGGLGPATNSGTAHVYFSDTGTCDAIGPAFAGGGTASGGGTQCPYQFNATFTPTQSQSVECEYSFTFTPFGGSPSSFLLYLDGSGGNVDGVSVFPTSLGLTAPTGMQSQPGSITVTNIGSGTVMVTPTVGDPRFTYNPGVVTLSGMGSNQVYTVHCSDSVAGMFMSTLTFAASPGTGSATQLTCTVYDPTGLMFSGDYHFPVTLVGSASMDQTVTASYGGSAMPLMMTITAPNVTGTGSGWAGTTFNGCIGTGCPAGTSFPVTLHWVPMTQVSGQLGFLNGRLGASGNVPVAINGDAEYANVVSNPTGLDAGAICAGNAAKAQSLDIYNAGLAPVTLASATVANVSPAGTMVALNPQPAPNTRLLASHGSDVMTSVTLTPPASASGPVSATLHLVLADVNKPSLDIAVTANAVAAASGVTATPNMLAFPTIPINMTSPTQTFVLTNCGTSPLMITDHPITDLTTNQASADFAIKDPPDPIGQIDPAGSMTFTITMTPQTIGAKTALLSLVHGDGTSTPVMLTGAGISDSGSGSGGKKNRHTYYACDAGRPGGFAPIALALLALRRRRK